MRGYWRANHTGVDVEARRYRKQGLIAGGVALVCFLAAVVLFILSDPRPNGSRYPALYSAFVVGGWISFLAAAIAVDSLLYKSRKSD